MEEPRVRAENTKGFGEAIRMLGLDVPALLAKVGLPSNMWEDPQLFVSLYAIDRLVIEAEARSGCDHIGLLAGSMPVDLGPPTYLFFSAPNLRRAIADVIASMHLMNEGGSFALEEREGIATVRYTNVAPMLRGAHHIADCVLAQAFAALTQYCGSTFPAQEIRFPRRKPHNLAPFRHHFPGVQLVFNTSEPAIDFPAEVLNTAGRQADASLHKFLKSRLASRLANVPISMKVRRALGFLTLDGTVRAESVARFLDMPLGKLKKQLAAEGVNIQKMANEVRHSTAVQLVKNTDLTISEIAVSLGYADTSTFSRSFSLREGVPPAAFRRRGLA